MEKPHTQLFFQGLYVHTSNTPWLKCVCLHHVQSPFVYKVHLSLPCTQSIYLHQSQFVCNVQSLFVSTMYKVHLSTPCKKSTCLHQSLFVPNIYLFYIQSLLAYTMHTYKCTIELLRKLRLFDFVDILANNGTDRAKIYF